MCSTINTNTRTQKNTNNLVCSTVVASHSRSSEMLELELEPDLLTRSLSPMEYLHKLVVELFNAFPFSFTYLLALDLPLGSSGLLPFRLPFLRSLLSPEVRIVDNVTLAISILFFGSYHLWRSRSSSGLLLFPRLSDFQSWCWLILADRSLAPRC